jgi:Hypervirulence associated proteins TUDOR domain
MSESNDFKPGDKVSWNWGSGHPSGTVAEVKVDEGG